DLRAPRVLDLLVGYSRPRHRPARPFLLVEQLFKQYQTWSDPSSACYSHIPNISRIPGSMAMPVFQVLSRRVQTTAQPKTPRVRIPYQWSFVIRLIVGLNIAGSIFGVLAGYGSTLTIFGISAIVFLLLPVLIDFASAQFQGYDLSIFFRGTFL